MGCASQEVTLEGPHDSQEDQLCKRAGQTLPLRGPAPLRADPRRSRGALEGPVWPPPPAHSPWAPHALLPGSTVVSYPELAWPGPPQVHPCPKTTLAGRPLRPEERAYSLPRGTGPSAALQMEIPQVTKPLQVAKPRTSKPTLLPELKIPVTGQGRGGQPASPPGSSGPAPGTSRWARAAGLPRAAAHGLLPDACVHTHTRVFAYLQVGTRPRSPACPTAAPGKALLTQVTSGTAEALYGPVTRPPDQPFPEPRSAPPPVLGSPRPGRPSCRLRPGRHRGGQW